MVNRTHGPYTRDSISFDMHCNVFTPLLHFCVVPKIQWRTAKPIPLLIQIWSFRVFTIPLYVMISIRHVQFSFVSALRWSATFLTTRAHFDGLSKPPSLFNVIEFKYIPFYVKLSQATAIFRIVHISGDQCWVNRIDERYVGMQILLAGSRYSIPFYYFYTIWKIEMAKHWRHDSGNMCVSKMTIMALQRLFGFAF